MPEHSVGRPVRELDFAHELRLDPQSVRGIESRDAVERRRLDTQCREASEQVAQHPVGEARAHATDVPQPTFVGYREQQ